MTEDLIRLDSTSDIDDFDPLKSDTGIRTNASSYLEMKNLDFSPPSDTHIPLTLSNPLYSYYEPQGLKQNGNVVPSTNAQHTNISRENSRNDHDLLQEYGIDFNNFNSSFISGQSASFDPFQTSSTSKVSSQSQWTKFD